MLMGTLLDKKFYLFIDVFTCFVTQRIIKKDEKFLFFHKAGILILRMVSRIFRVSDISLRSSLLNFKTNETPEYIFNWTL